MPVQSKREYNIFRSRIIEEYLEKYPHYGCRTVSRILFHDHPTHFKNEEHVRSLIRYRRGLNGDAARLKLKNPLYAKSFQST